MFKETGFDRLLKDRRDVPSDIVVKNLPANAGDSRDAGSIPGSGWSLKEEMATHSSFLSEQPDGQQSMGTQRVRHNWATEESMAQGIAES